MSTAQNSPADYLTEWLTAYNTSDEAYVFVYCVLMFTLLCIAAQGFG